MELNLATDKDKALFRISVIIYRSYFLNICSIRLVTI